MVRSGIFLLAVLAVAGCQKNTKPASAPDQAKVAELATQVQAMDARLQKIEGLLHDALNPDPEPDPKAVYAVPIAGEPFEGAEHAMVTIVKGYEFACGFCYRVRPTLAQLLEDYAGEVKIVYKYFVVHQQAVGPGLAGCAAHKQGKFFEMKALIWDKGFAEGELGTEKMEELAKEAGLDLERFRMDMGSEACMSSLRSSHQTLSNLGVNGTPAFYINGRFLSGAQPIEEFKKIIDEELARAKATIAGGVSVASYYKIAVLDKGQTKLE